jgi:hypothetical protein
MLSLMTHFLFTPQNRKGVALAFAPAGFGEGVFPDRVLDPYLHLPQLPFDLFLKYVVFGRGNALPSDELGLVRHLWFDFQPNEYAWPLFSERLRALVDRHASGAEGLAWLAVTVRAGAGEARPYFIPHFARPQDVLAPGRSVYVAGTDILVNPFFAQEKIAPLALFCDPSPCWRVSLGGLYVSRAIREDAKRLGLVGLHFEDIRIV